MTTKSENTATFRNTGSAKSSVLSAFKMKSPQRQRDLATCRGLQAASSGNRRSGAKLGAYGQAVKDIFHHHRIPLAGTLEEPLVQFPLTKAVILLLNLPAKDFVRSQVIDLLSSPYFQFEISIGESSSVRPDIWDLATRELANLQRRGRVAALRRYSHRDLDCGRCRMMKSRAKSASARCS